MTNPIEDAVQLIKMEYAEMPDLRLTFFQAQRLWNLSRESCERALRALTEAEFLQQTDDGLYVRHGGMHSRGRTNSTVIRRLQIG